MLVVGDAQPVVGVGLLDTVVGRELGVLGRLDGVLSHVGELVSLGAHDDVFSGVESVWNDRSHASLVNLPSERFLLAVSECDS